MSVPEQLPTLNVQTSKNGESALSADYVKELLSPYADALLAIGSDAAKTNWLMQQHPELSKEDATTYVLELNKNASDEVQKYDLPEDVKALLRAYYFAYYVQRYWDAITLK